MNISSPAGIHPYSRLGQMEALEGAIMLERKLEVAANNTSNMNTTGFKQARVTFQEFLSRTQDNTARTGKMEKGWADFSQGPARFTGNPFDILISGQGFFKIQGPGGDTFYTRAGSFRLDDQKQLVTAEGYPVLGDGAPIVLDDTTGKGVWLSDDGYFFVDDTAVAKIDVVKFQDTQGLKRVGKNMFSATKASGPEQVMEPSLRQGYIEGSNVNPAEQMVQLIDLYRGYEMQQKSLQAADQLDDKAVNQVGKVR